MIRRKSMLGPLPIYVAALLLILRTIHVQANGEFSPYTDHGGLVSAVAGRSYCILACDTRLMDGGYQIKSRNQGIGSRLWTPEKETSAAAVWVAAAGCAPDVHALQTTFRREWQVGQAFLGKEKKNPANLLSQILYSRRFFPYYCFCIVGGFGAGGSDTFVCVYDAIGSYEQVAVATQGTGRHLLQPILDQAFVAHDQKTVADSCDQAVAKLVQAYRAVAEREIGVGDKLALVVMSKDANGDIETETLHVPLKAH